MGKLVIGFVLVALAVIVGVVAWWWLDLRWRPKTVSKNQAEIARLLEQAGWVSPGNGGPKVYILVFRSCPDCVRLKADVVPALVKAGVDTRVIAIARRDLNGAARSTPPERATVAELWLNRDWSLMQRWDASPLEAWTAQGLHPVEGDMARTAVIEAGRDLVDQIRPLLAANGVAVSETGVRYPTLIWWDEAGAMKATVCERPEPCRAVLRAFKAG